MKINCNFLLLIFSVLFFRISEGNGQVVFNRVPLFDENVRGFIVDMAQDQKGYMWLAGTSLYRYDGYHLVTYKNDPANPHSITPARLESICVDRNGIIWIGTFDAGLERFDPSTGLFTHFVHNPKDSSTLSNNIVTAIIEDKDGTIWVGTHGGLNHLDQETGKFTRYNKIPGDETSLSNDQVRAVYETADGTIWIGCGSPYGNETPPGEGGLNKLDKKTGKFTRYLHNSKNESTLIDNKVRAIYEDSRGTFWVGTFGDGLHIMDRQNGTFKRLRSDPAHPGKLSTPLVNGKYYGVNFIREDKTGNIWIGSFFGGLNRFDPKTLLVTHYEAGVNTTGDLQENSLWAAASSRDGVLWITTQTNVYRVDPVLRRIEHVTTGGQVRDFLEDTSGTLWIGSDSGLIRSEKNNKTLRYFLHDPQNASSISRSLVTAVCEDKKGLLWIGTGNGLNLFNKQTGTFKNFLHDPKDANTISEGIVTSMLDDQRGTFWLGTEYGLDVMDRRNNTFKHYINDPADTTSISKDAVYCLIEDRQGNLWVGAWNGGGINLLDRASGKFKHYLKGNNIFTIFEDSDGMLWVGTEFGLYRYNREQDAFLLFTDPASEIGTANIVSIVEDDKKYLWIGSQSGIFKINPQRNETSIYGKKYGVKTSSIFDLVGYKTGSGELLFGDATGYYRFFPESLTSNSVAPQVIITDFKISDVSVLPGHRPLSGPVELIDEIKLGYKQNVFSFDFAGIHYSSPDENRHLYMLEGYEKNWRRAGSEKTASYFNVPPGEYIFRVKAASSEGIWENKSIKIIITPPWWKRWWAYAVFCFLIAGAIWAIVHYRSRKLVNEKRLLEYRVRLRTKEIQKQNKEIARQRDNLEKTLDELKSTQDQLVQHEKMASLGLLTAGIAHEIKNPLNFVNNFAEVSVDLLKEMDELIENGNIPELKALAIDVKQNLEKITHHGKLADAIVTGMQRHVRRSTGKRELTDINSLADEYLWIFYNRFKEKEKNFEARLQTDFDNNIPKINVVPEDFGIALSNIFNNAFYAVSEKKKTLWSVAKEIEYEATVSVTSKMIPGGEDAGLEIIIRDNGTGIPAHLLNRVFQPFFTTKPAGKGTGLGLSLSYDIITKGHGGKVRVESRENEYTEFVIFLPKQN